MTSAFALPAALDQLTGAAKQLTMAIQSYQLAITHARKEGATWEQLGTAAGLPVPTARSRHRVAVEGGEFHLKLRPLHELLEEQS